MNLAPQDLRDLMVEIAARQYDGRFFRRELMEATECEVRQRGQWTSEDDLDSRSAGAKSRGLATIDWTFSWLAKQGRILSIRRGEWRLPDKNP